MLKMVLPLIALATPGIALAQANQCRLPDVIARPRIEGPTAEDPKRVLPIGYYTLAVSWTPQYCKTSRGGARDAFQCQSDNSFAFTLHGLWPDGYGEQWPQYCKAAGILPRKVIRDHLCATPSVQLIQHEWVKHGTCMPTNPTAFFALSRKLYHALRYPDMAELAQRPTLSARAFAEAFAARNKGMVADGIRLNVTRDGSLSEVWICMDRKYRYISCPPQQGGVRDRAQLRIEPPR
ncbi:ribonuclease T [Sphingobium sp. 3R8]|uniref:ribonuclease T2 family protein n=1 Tax=Sphingobium sp. 3R8 TaxID=2874921 RepID=UPI001CCFF719|nr:ribonuclease T [Sphingobium sp. 3R8]MBZ9648705.1 ribonuclease T [Sphingobium sp. 3R8]